MLCEELMERLRPITEEEQQILLGSDIDRKRYTTGREFTMDRHRLLEKGKLMDIRTHTRFVHFPRHRHNYIEAIYMCSGSTTHILGASRSLQIRTQSFPDCVLFFFFAILYDSTRDFHGTYDGRTGENGMVFGN